MISPVSILIPAFQAYLFIEECLDSIQCQTYFQENDKWEVLIGVDGCQQTLDKLVQIRDKYTNLKIFMMGSNQGTYVTINTLVDLSNYSNIIIFGADDIMMPEMVSKIMSKDGDVIQFYFLNFENKIDNAVKNRFASHGAIFYKKSIFDIVGGFQPWKCAADTELLNRLKDSNVNFVEIEDALFYRRIHKDSLTQRIDTSYGSDLRREYQKMIRNYENIYIEKIINRYNVL